MKVEIVSGKCLTTIGIGGDFTVFFPETFDEVVQILSNENAYVIGGGSNLVLPDDGKKFNLVSFSNLKRIKIGNDTLLCEAGVKISEIINLQLKRKFSLFEFLAGVPDVTVGGAVAQNAGAFGRETVEFLKAVRYIDLEGNLHYLTDFFSFGYRKSPFPDRGVIWEAEFFIREEKKIKEIVKEFVINRLKKHPPFYLKTAGSTFKNPEKVSAGYLIDKAGLKGFSVGGLKVSEIHANFIINFANGTFSDFCRIVDTIREKVFKIFGVELELEVKVPGFTF
ncbi:UDP-N-acetylmuramate dehydrogenase [Desulfurobacterium atlanticum]|uniref:UDP-N-acetylenolpyruvoylglucosamine reductase n=1 Tax=Desulfurobacterium atlanticum TaxID=240169 RepID=A0A238Z6J1_9BACT|nr:UDP-N-acetylmuramate dehydrogenase [Desulfurobacterium atlanticum]SNR78414.1 UDP-N-acetylmuramate dehydrogenase [Desulfurobacterium atlanticum]